MGFRTSQLEHLRDPDAFWWATGIEDTFITAPWPKTGRTLDAYELTDHYGRWDEDLRLMADLGVRTARYGVPWHQINPAPGQWDWSFADKTLSRLLELGIDPIVDLVHYGLPPWIENAYFHPDFPQYMAEYAGRVAERFRGSIFAYTPLNEPRVTSWYCGKLGWWPPFARGWRGFVKVMLAVSRGMVQTVERLRSVDPEIVPVHVDATDLYESADPTLQSEVQHRQEIVFLALDLISGRLRSGHPLHGWLLSSGATEEDLRWFQSHAVDLPLIGINLYPMFSRKILSRSKWGLRTRMPRAGADIIDHLGQLYWERYRRPLMITETAADGRLSRRRDWLDTSVAAVKRLRERGVPMVGYTWWPLFALVAWAHRQGAHPVSYYLKQMGLWDLAASPEAGLTRVRTPLVDAYQSLVSAGSEPVGRCTPQPDPLLYVS